MSMLVEQRGSSLKKSRPYSEPILSNDDALSYPSGIRPELLDAWTLKCAFVVDEILHTEQDYIASLEGIIGGYRVPLSNHLHSTNEGNRVVGVIFGNIEDLYELHQMLLKKLRIHECDPHEFGQVFLQTDGFKLYTEYCTNYDSALECLQNQLKNSKEIRELILRCQRRLGQPLDLTSQLIKPVQRIMRYHLLLHQLVKKFNPNHYGYPTLSHAHKTMAQIADHINQVKKQKENAIRVQDIQSYLSGWSGKEAEKNLSAYGELMFESPCKVGKKGAERLVILFEKLLLILKKKDAKRYNYKGHILAKELCVDENEVDGNSTAFIVYSHQNPNQTFEIQAVSTKKRKEWVTRINHLCLVVLKREEREDEEEYQKFVKRRKTFLGTEMGTGGHSQPKRSQSEGKIHSRRIPWHRKRARTDVRQVFHEEEQTSTTNGIPQESSSSILPSLPESTTIETIPTDPSIFDSGHYFTSSDRQSSEKSMSHSVSNDSLLSLEDVELTGDFDEVDAGDERPRHRKKRSTPSRRAAIKVKRNKSIREPNSLNTSKEDTESELSRLMSPPTAEGDTALLLDSSMESDSLYQSGRYSKDSLVDSSNSNSSAYQVEIELRQVPDIVSDSHEYANEGVVGVAEDGGDDRGMEFDSGVVVEHRRSSGALGAALMHGGGELVCDQDQSNTLRRGEDLLVEESGVVILEENSESEDIVIMEDSSDSEDEEEGYENDVHGAEGYQSVLLATIAEQRTSVDPPTILGDHEVPVKDDSSELFKELSQEESTESNRGLIDTSTHDRSQPLLDDISDHTPLDMSLPLLGRSDIELYATLPRKSRTKPTTPSPRSSVSTPGIGGTRYLSTSSTLSRDRPGSKRYRSAQFNQLLEFTRQQATPVRQTSPMRQASTPEDTEYDLTQSLPVSVMGSKSLQQLLEDAEPEHDVHSDSAISPRVIPFATQEEPVHVDENETYIQKEDMSSQLMNVAVHVETQMTESTVIGESNRSKESNVLSTRDITGEENIKGADVHVQADIFGGSISETQYTKAQQDNAVHNHVETETDTERKQTHDGTDDDRLTTCTSERDKAVETFAPIDDSKTVTETSKHQVAELDSKESTPPLLDKEEESVTVQSDVSILQTAPVQELTRRITSKVVRQPEENVEEVRNIEPIPPDTSAQPQASSRSVLGVISHWTRIWGYRVRSYLPTLNIRSGLILVGVALLSSYMIYSGFIGGNGSTRSSAAISGTDRLSEPHS